MKEITCNKIKETVKELFLQANYEIGTDIMDSLKNSLVVEEGETGRQVLEQIIKNNQIAAAEGTALCQDTGMAIIFVKLGQEVRIVDGDFNTAINEGVREAYITGYLRKSVVDDPLFERVNTRDNTPAIIYVEMAAGDMLEIEVTAKGFGSENMSGMKVLTPADGLAGMKEFVVETVKKAGSNPCPPIVVGVGVGGTIDKAAFLAKTATIRKIGEYNKDFRYAQLEKELLQEINNLGIGPAGLGGTVTALAVHVDYFPTHIASLPVVVNICCHAARHARAAL